MGRDKRQLRLGDATLLQRNLAFLQGIFPVVGISVRDAGQVPADLPPSIEVVPDIAPGSPLAGLASVLTRFREPVFALAADIAFPDRSAAERVLAAFRDVDVALPIAEEHLEPLHAVYGPGCLPHIERLLAAGAHSILDLYPEVRVAQVPFPTPAPFFNVNTQQDWETARRRFTLPSRGVDRHTPVITGRPAVLGVVGRPLSGKTTLIERLIPEFRRAGLRVGAVKSVARFEIDVPGKDSWRHGQAGAAAYAVASSSKLAFVARQQTEMPLNEIVARHFSGFDLVICEGYRQEAPSMVEVFRRGAGHTEPVCSPGAAIALVTDTDLPHPHRFGLDEPARLARFLLSELDLVSRLTYIPDAGGSGTPRASSRPSRSAHRTSPCADRDDSVAVAEVRFPDDSLFRNIHTINDHQAARGETMDQAQAEAGGQPALVAIVGKSDSGKTTLIEKVVPELVKLGLRVGTVKHDAHSFEIDHPGKDSWRHGQAGAEAYVIASPERLAFITKLDGEVPLAEIARRYFAGFDLVVAEGYKRTAPHRVELFRVGAGHAEPLCGPGEAIALVTDADFEHEHRFGLEDGADLARFLSLRLDALRVY